MRFEFCLVIALAVLCVATRSQARLARLSAYKLDSKTGAAASPWRHHASRTKETWKHAEELCRAAGLGGLLTAEGRLDELTGHLNWGQCYWVRRRESLSRGGSHHFGRCPCVRLTGGGSIRVHHIGCRNRRRFLCQRGRPVDEERLKRRTTLKPRPKTKTVKALTKTSRVKTDPDDEEIIPIRDDEADQEQQQQQQQHPALPSDEAVDHAKFAAIPLRPDGRPQGWLPPWGSGGAATKAAAGTSTIRSSGGESTTPPMMVDFEVGEKGGSNATADAKDQALKSPLNEEKSEFITLLVLYTIVGVTLLVLLALCLVRCCRGYCGKARIRYVKHVDADDIPRFMPSSWA